MMIMVMSWVFVCVPGDHDDYHGKTLHIQEGAGYCDRENDDACWASNMSPVSGELGFMVCQGDGRHYHGSLSLDSENDDLNIMPMQAAFVCKAKSSL